MFVPAPYSTNKLNQKGITLIELLIAVSLIAILTGALIPSFSGYIQSQNLRQAQEQVKNDLRTAQNSALTGENKTFGSAINYWGIYFPDNSKTYSFFTSVGTTSCGSETVLRNSTSLPGDIVIRNATDECVYFSFTDGSSPSSELIAVGSPSASGNDCLGIEVNAAGAIISQDNVACN